MPPKSSPPPAGQIRPPQQPENLLIARLGSADSLSRERSQGWSSSSVSASRTDSVRSQPWPIRPSPIRPVPLAGGSSDDMDIDGNERTRQRAARRAVKRSAPATARAGDRTAKRSASFFNSSQNMGTGASDTAAFPLATREQSSIAGLSNMDIDTRRAASRRSRQTALTKAKNQTSVSELRGYETADELGEPGDVTRASHGPGIGKIEVHDLAYQMLFMKLTSRRRKG